MSKPEQIVFSRNLANLNNSQNLANLNDRADIYNKKLANIVGKVTYKNNENSVVATNSFLPIKIKKIRFG